MKRYYVAYTVTGSFEVDEEEEKMATNVAAEEIAKDVADQFFPYIDLFFPHVEIEYIDEA